MNSPVDVEKSSSLSFFFFIGLVSIGFGFWLENAPTEKLHLVEESMISEEVTEFDSVTVVVVGDIMFSRFYNAPFRDYFADIFLTASPIFDNADLLIGNLEGAIAPPNLHQKEFDFAFKDEYARLLADYSFSAVSLANNHTLDQGSNGYELTKTRLESVGVGYFGHQFDEIAPIYYQTVEDTTVAVVGFNLTNRPADRILVKKQMSVAVNNSDYQIVMVHWGTEYEHLPNDEQIDFGRRLVDWGADAVIGAHPHVTQGMEVYKNVPILWSLGNFVFDQQFSQAVTEGVMIQLDLSSQSTEVRIVPYKIIDDIPTSATSTRVRQLQEFFQWSDLPEDIKYSAEAGTVSISN